MIFFHLLQLKMCNFQRGWRLGHRFITAPSQNPTDIAKIITKHYGNGHLHMPKSLQNICQIECGLVQIKAEKPNLELCFPRKRLGGDSLVELYLHQQLWKVEGWIQCQLWVRRSLWSKCLLLQFINRSQGCSARKAQGPGWAAAASATKRPSGFSLMLCTEHPWGCSTPGSPIHPRSIHVNRFLSKSQLALEMLSILEKQCKQSHCPVTGGCFGGQQGQGMGWPLLAFHLVPWW